MSINIFERIPGAIPDDLPEEGMIGASLFLRISENSLEGFKVRVDIRYNSELHRTISNRSIFPRRPFLRNPPNPHRRWRGAFG
ncbi:hypothetical protein SBV1_1440042 [Verrucomicrobia bacterium]|nr:hypothetical protein SBV1_1440042 [Verrucomicrobiota bacterium]